MSAQSGRDAGAGRNEAGGRGIRPDQVYKSAAAILGGIGTFTAVIDLSLPRKALVAGAVIVI